MRWINKHREPLALTEWRARYQNDVNFGYPLLRSDHAVTEHVVNSLVEEQGWLCAYTGIHISPQKCHIDHVNAQVHCTPAEAVAYSNMVACYPRPNFIPEPKFGARKKADWPSPGERHLFVSPLDRSCEARFNFGLHGQISQCNATDIAAGMTIKRLGLDDGVLSDWRGGAIRGTLGKDNRLPIRDARRRLRQLSAQNPGHLEEFCFVLKQALEKHIARLEGIARSRKAKRP